MNANTGIDTMDYNHEYEKIGEGIYKFRSLRQKLMDDKAQKIMMGKRIEEIRQFLKTQESPLEEFDGNMFWRFIEKVRVESVVEVKEIL
ncbi:hypothetical protein [Clostridium sp.]|uniref:hypothetical protein n=1 Tax=Clostridium sp. TaxID=1506 RepID=UPI0025BC5A65|nr:hypothetical protein [Clostridium sp.]